MGKTKKIPQAEFDAKVAAVSEIDWARLAAFVDGEGSISIGRSQPNPKYGQLAVQYCLALSVNNTDVRLIAWLKHTFSGEAYDDVHGIGEGKLSKKMRWAWIIQEGRAATILRHCMPYFIIKREQAEVALAYREIRESSSRGHRVTDDEEIAREKVWRSMRKLNTGDPGAVHKVQ